jgi:hypothetical protein
LTANIFYAHYIRGVSYYVEIVFEQKNRMPPHLLLLDTQSRADCGRTIKKQYLETLARQKSPLRERFPIGRSRSADRKPNP